MLTSDEIDDLRDDIETYELVDTITIYRQDGETEDPVTFEPVPNWIVVHADLPALVVREPQFMSVVTQADAPTATRMYHVTVPASADQARVEDVAVVTACHDPETLESALTVKDLPHGTLTVSRRLRCQSNLTYPRGLPEVDGS